MTIKYRNFPQDAESLKQLFVMARCRLLNEMLIKQLEDTQKALFNLSPLEPDFAIKYISYQEKWKLFNSLLDVFSEVEVAMSETQPAFAATIDNLFQSLGG